MRLKIPLFLLLLSSFSFAAEKPTSDQTRFRPVDAVIEEAIANKYIPGAVLLVGHNGKVVYHKAYGSRSLEPTQEAMTEDTIFDIASLTKPTATAMSMMRLMQLGKFRLNDPVSKYIPEFGQNGKEEITIRQLMTHYSGLREDLDLQLPWAGREAAFKLISEEKPVTPPGSKFIYSDINYEILGFLVERLSGTTLEKYAEENVFTPLKMNHTRFLPPKEWMPKIAPTEYDGATMLRGTVHDPTARRMGGVAGHAGVFSTADDLSKFAQAMLDRDKILTPLLIEKMTTPQQPPWATSLRGLGWDIDTPFSSSRGELLPIGSFGHTGFTGISLWIDPYTKTYIILLTNAVHPRTEGDAWGKVSLRTKVSNAIEAALDLYLDDKATQKIVTITGYNDPNAGAHRPVNRNGEVLNGIDVLEANGFDLLRGKRVGILTNQTGLDRKGSRTIDLLAHADGVKLTAIFSPEHGAVGELDISEIGNSKDPATGIQIFSVYGATDAARRPKSEQLQHLDAVVIDIQDVGARFYTYEATMGYFLEAAAKAGIEVIVLDRPNPITGAFVQGPVSDPPPSFVNPHPLPNRHGMTMGELTKFFNSERKINARVTVVPMRGWMRGDWFDSVGQLWVNPSPNMRDLTEATLYPGVAIIEATNVSVGRGTDTPFEVVGAPWISHDKARELSDYLNARQISGVRFVPVVFTPKSAIFGNQKCGGINITLTDRIALDSPELGIEIATALSKIFPNDFKTEPMRELFGNKAAFESMVAGHDPRRIADEWRDALEEFIKTREKYLIYK